MDSEKQYSVRSQTGRQAHVLLSRADFEEPGSVWDLSHTNDPEDDLEQTLGEWLDGCDIGDSYLHADMVCEIVRVS